MDRPTARLSIQVYTSSSPFKGVVISAAQGELAYKGKTHKVAVTTSGNGFIVGANVRGTGT